MTTPFLMMNWMTYTRGQAQAVSNLPYPGPAYWQGPISIRDLARLSGAG